MGVVLAMSNHTMAAATTVDAELGDTVSAGQYSSKKVSKVQAKSSNKKIQAKVKTFTVNGVKNYSVNTSIKESYFNSASGTESSNITITYYDKSKKKTITQKVKVIFHDGYQYKREHLILVEENKTTALKTMKRSSSLSSVNTFDIDKYEDYCQMSHKKNSNTINITGIKKGNAKIVIQAEYKNGEIIKEEYTLLIVDSKKKMSTTKVLDGKTTQLYLELPLTGKVTLKSSNKAIVTTEVQQLSGRKYFKDKWMKDFDAMSGYNSNQNKLMTSILLNGKSEGKATVTVTYKNEKTGKNYKILIPVQVVNKSVIEEVQKINLVNPIVDSEYTDYLTDQLGNPIGGSLTNLESDRHVYVQKYDRVLIQGRLGEDFNIKCTTRDLKGKKIDSFTKSIEFVKGTITENPQYIFEDIQSAMDYFNGGWLASENLVLKFYDNGELGTYYAVGNPWNIGDWEIYDATYSINIVNQTITIKEGENSAVASYSILDKDRFILTVEGQDYLTIRDKR